METNSPADDTPPAPQPETMTPAELPHDPAEELPEAVGTPPDAVDSDEPTDFPEETEAPEAPLDPPTETDELTQLAEASQRARLSPADEERMATLLKEALQGGRAGVARAVVALPKVPWIVGVRAVEAVWPSLTAGFRTQLLAGLAKEESDASRRIRLSLARALFKLEPPVGLKLAVGVARELRDKETGLLTNRQAQIFANVFIGRGKPWLAQLSLAELKPADGDALVHAAVLAVFTLPHPPVTQLGVLKWAREQERLSKLDAVAMETVKKGLARWSAKWQGALRKEVGDLPEDILVILKPAGGSAGDRQETGAGEVLEPGEPNVAEGAEASEAGEKAEDDEDEDEEDDDEEDEDEDEGDEEDDEEDEDEAAREKARKPRPVYEPRPQKPVERPVYSPRNAGGAPKNFNLNEALRNIDNYVQALRAELHTAQAKSRSREGRDDRRADKLGPIIPGEPTPEELARLNQQLEGRNTELQERITELTQHSEDVAVSTGALTGAPVEDPAAQLRTLLALKLREDFADFAALEKESNDLVVQQHYRALLRHVFEVLQQLDVPLRTE